jgi:hypothetical protein
MTTDTSQALQRNTHGMRGTLTYMSTNPEFKSRRDSKLIKALIFNLSRNVLFLGPIRSFHLNFRVLNFRAKAQNFSPPHTRALDLKNELKYSKVFKALKFREGG